uniref:Beta-sandwich protein n=1 Tax=Marseillevirus LCMAC202 TaxID=2506606 RepID=A0A481YXA9_9VIRU|nr:MAG: beta-sandwich protein [Marseillevirus LCMAC202]
MDGVYPTSYCPKQPVACCGNKTISGTGGTWVSTAFIRNRGQTSFATQVYDEGWPDYLTNNPPPTPLYVRAAPSQYDANKLVFWINGWERPRLILTCGKKYQFNVSTCGQPFYFTSDPEGGNGDKGNVTSVVPSDFYVSTYTMNPGVQQKFYYQSANKAGMGGEVVIKES